MDSGTEPADSGVVEPADSGVVEPIDSGVVEPDGSVAPPADSGTTADAGDTPPTSSFTGSGGCSVDAGSSHAPLWLIALVGSVLFRRRRRI